MRPTTPGVAVGLAGGIKEPLKSTGIHLIETGIRLLIIYCGGSSEIPILAEHYSRLMRRLYDKTRDFIVLQYLLTDRDDSNFWRFYNTRSSVPLSDNLRDKLELWRFKMASASDPTDSGIIFKEPNFNFVLFGMDWSPDGLPPGISHLDPERGRRLLAEFRSTIGTTAMQISPDHYEMVTRLRGSFDTGALRGTISQLRA